MSYARMYLTRINLFTKALMRFSQGFSRHKSHLPLPLMISWAHCSENQPKLTPIQFAERNLTHEHLIHQACSASVNSATQLLTQVLVAVIDTGDQYRKAMEELIQLLDESVERTVHGVEQGDLNDMLVAARARVAELNKSVMQLNSLMEYVEKYVQSTADAAFIAGAETVCNAMSDRLHAAQQEILSAKEKNKKLEEDCLKVQKTLVIETEERQKKRKKQDLEREISLT